MTMLVERQSGSVERLEHPARPFAFTQEEGGEFFSITYQSKLVRPAAIFFEDGACYDLVLERLGQNPWQQKEDVARIKALLGD